FLRRRLIAADRGYRREADLVRPAVVGLQRRRDRTQRGWVDAAARPLQLNALQAARSFVHLKEGDDRDPAYGLSVQHDIDIAVAEIETSGELRCGAVELLQQVLRSLTPIDLPQQLRNGICRRRGRPGSGEHECEQQDRVETRCCRFPPFSLSQMR